MSYYYYYPPQFEYKNDRSKFIINKLSIALVYMYIHLYFVIFTAHIRLYKGLSIDFTKYLNVLNNYRLSSCLTFTMLKIN